MDYGGIIAGAIGGGANAVGQLADKQIDDNSRAKAAAEAEEARERGAVKDQGRRVDLAQVESDIALSRTKAIEAYKTEQGNTERTARAERIQGGAEGIIRGRQVEQWNKDLGLEGEAALKEGDLSPEELARFKPSERDWEGARKRAMENSGDRDPNQEVQSNSRTAALEAKVAAQEALLKSREGIAARGEAGKTERNDATNASREDAAAARAAAVKDKAEKGPTAERLSTLLNNNVNARKAHENRSRGNTAESKAAWKAKDDAYEQEEAELRALARSRRDGGEPTPAGSGTVKAAAPPAAPSSIPAPKTAAERDKLPSGTRYTAPDGSIKIKG